MSARQERQHRKGNDSHRVGLRFRQEDFTI
jgi:hypothetical protein